MFLTEPSVPKMAGAQNSTEACSGPRDKKFKNIFDDALATPPLPSGRGEIKHACQERGADPSEDNDKVIAFIERAITTNPRTTCRVWDGERKRSWVEITEKKSINHYSIVESIATHQPKDHYIQRRG